MATWTHEGFLAICFAVKTWAEVKDAVDTADGALKACKTALKGKMTDPRDFIRNMGSADLRKAQLKIAPRIKEAQQIGSAQIKPPKSHADQYEKALSLKVKKHGPDPKNKEVASALKALQKQLGKEVVAHYNLLTGYKRAVGELEDMEKRAAKVSAIWYKLAKDFQAVMVLASSMPALSGLAAQFMANGQIANELGAAYGTLNGHMRNAVRQSGKNRDTVQKQYEYLDEFQKHTQKKSYLQEV